MGEHEIVRSLLLRIAGETQGTAPLARVVLNWARPRAKWLLGEAPAKPLGWRALLDGLVAAPPRAELAPAPLRHAAMLAEALRLGNDDARLLLVSVAFERCSQVRSLTQLLVENGCDLVAMLGHLAGMEPHAIRRSPVLRLELAHLRSGRSGRIDLELGWDLSRLLDSGAESGEELLEVVVGPRQRARLGLADFTDRESEAGLMVRMLRGALRERATGVNILLHGPPGTGKTELARTIAAEAGGTLYSVGEADEDGEEPSRWQRVNALGLAQRMLAGVEGAMLLFDEMEDLIGDAEPAAGDWVRKRQGSKLWVNRQLEANAVPVIWTTNAIGNIDPAILRRMSYVLQLDLPSRAAGLSMLDRIAADEAVAVPPSMHAFVSDVPEAATVLRVGARAGRLAGDDEAMACVTQALVGALRGGVSLPVVEEPVDLDLYETDLDLPALLARLGEAEGPQDFSLLLTGPPGTGKTGLAHQLARALDRPLIVKRASDLLSKWVGETEAQIADAFREAERRGGVLLFDEVDSLLFDRATAQRSWEVTQVNELLTWLDRHPLPFVAATNHAGRLDPAALRRFVFKLELRPLGVAKAARAFERFFGQPAPAELAELANLTAGDFAVVRRQLRHSGTASPAGIVALLRAEAAAKPGQSARLGF